MTEPQTSIGLVLDCADPVALGEFWAAALDYVSAGEFGSYVALFPNGRSGPKLLLQRVAESKNGKNRMHLDIETSDIEAEAARLIGLGATRFQQDTLSEQGTTWVLMNDPEGNEFCVCDAGQPHG